MATSTNTWTGLLQTLQSAFNDASLAKRHKNILSKVLTRDFQPQVADVFSTINTNIMASTYGTTQLPQGGGVEATPVNININPGPITLNQHPVIVMDLPNMDTTIAGSSYVAKVADESYKIISNAINQYLAGLFIATKFNAYAAIAVVGYPENSYFGGVTIPTKNNVTTPALMAAWNALAANQVPVGDIGNVFLVTATDVYSNILQNPNMVMSANIGNDPATLISTTARFSTRFGLIIDWDPDFNAASGSQKCFLLHRYAGAVVSRAVAPPRNPSIPVTYVELFPGENGQPGITARLVVDFWPPAAADRLLIDCLFGADITRPDHGIQLTMSTTLREGEEEAPSAPSAQPHAAAPAHDPKKK